MGQPILCTTKKAKIPSKVAPEEYPPFTHVHVSLQDQQGSNKTDTS